MAIDKFSAASPVLEAAMIPDYHLAQRISKKDDTNLLKNVICMMAAIGTRNYLGDENMERLRF